MLIAPADSLNSRDCIGIAAPPSRMVSVERQALVAYSAARMSLRDARRTVATIHVAYRGVRQQFTTENRKRPGERIEMTLVEGPFRSLRGEWRFTPLHPTACRVELALAYQLASPTLDRLVGPVFDHIANTFVDAFVRRADALHSGGRS